MTPDTFIGEFGAVVGIAGLTLDAEGQCRLTFAGRGDLPTVAATDGSLVPFAPGLHASLGFTLQLGRDSAGQTSLIGLTDASLRLNAFDPEGWRVR